MKTAALFQFKKLLPVLIVGLFFFSCQKDIDEPKHKNKGRNIIYLKIDEQEFLIKEGFTLNRNVIRADIRGQTGMENPTYFEDVAFGKPYGSLTINLESKESSDQFTKGSITLDFYIGENSSVGLLQFMHLPFFSEKHNEKIQFHMSSYLSPGKVEIFHHNEQDQTIEGSYNVNYFDFSDSTKKGTLYLYFDLSYINI